MKYENRFWEICSWGGKSGLMPPPPREILLGGGRFAADFKPSPLPMANRGIRPRIPGFPKRGGAGRGASRWGAGGAGGAHGIPQNRRAGSGDPGILKMKIKIKIKIK